jgi:biopolymer transport protein TolR
MPRLSRHRKKHFELNITPLIDIVLVLLVIFMISTPAIVNGINLNLPENSTKSKINENDKKYIVISYTKDGVFNVDDKIVNYENLVDEVKKSSKNDYDYKIYIRGDKEVKYGEVVSIVSLLGKNGFKKTTLLTKAVDQ